ncbi:MAG: flagellin [Pseudomonadota bacterium]
MTRIANYASYQTILLEFTRNQRDIFETQRQVSTGKVAQDYKGIGDDVSLLLSSKDAAARADRYIDLGKQVQTRIDLQDVTLESFASSAGDLRQAVTEAVAQNSGLVLMERLQSVLSTAVSALNSEIDGHYVFAGTRTDTPPVNISTLADLQAAPAVADIFDNNGVRPAINIDENLTIEYGFLANEVGQDLFQALRDIADFNSGPNGPFGTELTDAQATFLQGLLPTLEAVGDSANEVVGQNGVFFNEVEDAMVRNERRRDYMLAVVADIEDVDMAAAVTKLNEDQIAAEATAKVLADMSRLSLLQFL